MSGGPLLYRWALGWTREWGLPIDGQDRILEAPATMPVHPHQDEEPMAMDAAKLVQARGDELLENATRAALTKLQQGHPVLNAVKAAVLVVLDASVRTGESAETMRTYVSAAREHRTSGEFFTRIKP